MAIKDYSITPDMNTQISGINIAEGCAPSGINNAIRQLMADVKEESEAVAAKDAAQDAAIANVANMVSSNATAQAAKNAEQDTAIANVANMVSSNATAQDAKNAEQDTAIAGKLNKTDGFLNSYANVQTYYPTTSNITLPAGGTWAVTHTYIPAPGKDFHTITRCWNCAGGESLSIPSGYEQHSVMAIRII